MAPDRSAADAGAANAPIRKTLARLCVTIFDIFKIALLAPKTCGP